MYIADLHIHSRYSRATSRDCTPEHLELWARRKGIGLLGTGDFTHPAWRQELAEKLSPAEEGLYILKEEYRIREEGAPDDRKPRFVVTGEISSIYKKDGRVRKIHSLILLPDLEAAERICTKLEQIGNIHSDGRPILGLDCRDLLEIVLELCPEAVYVPAHIWTPHFSLFGAFSGFDTIEECFGDLAPHIHALETGLSSDPPMNWRVSALDGYQLISNSDAHSPAKLGREANLLDIPLSYQGLARALQTGEGLQGTIEFFPEEGKYHMDGHRKCSLCLTPAETIKHQGICPVCGRKITIGVSHRVEELADRPEGYVKSGAKGFENLVPLPEVIGASLGTSAASKKAQREYLQMIAQLGPEFEILRNLPLEDIQRVAGIRVAEGIQRLRQGQVERIPGFDGEYGTIRLFSQEELENTEGQMDFFALLGLKSAPRSPGRELRKGKIEGAEVSRNEGEFPKEENLPEEAAVTAEVPEEAAAAVEELKGAAVTAEVPEEAAVTTEAPEEDSSASAPLLNAEQHRAVCSLALHLAVKAGPGTGKTKTLVSRIQYLLQNRGIKPGEITAVTFTNQAAAEMRERISQALGQKQLGRELQIGTFHGICLNFLREQGEQFTLLGEGQARKLAEETLLEQGLSGNGRKFLEAVSLINSGAEEGRIQEIFRDVTGTDFPEKARAALEAYREKKEQRGLWDFDDLLLKTIEKIQEGQVKEGWERRFRYLLVDEFQDINPVQRQLIRLWCSYGGELFAIGDADQSIYGFRGADADCFEKLKEEYPDLELIQLKENYRSTPQIVDTAQTVIAHNPGPKRLLRANRPGGAPVRVVQAKSPLGEAIFVAKEINRLAGGIGMLEAHREAWERHGRKIRSFGDIAVLYRTHRQAELLEKCLKKEGIPYLVAGREDFLQEPAVQGSLEFFRFLEQIDVDGGREEMAGFKEIREELKLCAETLWQLPWNSMSQEIIRNTAEKFAPLFKKQKPRKFLERWMEELQLSDNPAMQKLSQMTVFYKTMEEFLEAMTLGVESDLKRCGGKGYTAEAVTLMTLHGSKGLEFPVTILYGVNQGTLPLESQKHPADPREERRLFYVGMTRAREELIITTSRETSPFLQELCPSASGEQAVVWEQAERQKKEETFRQLSLFD